MDTEKRLMFLAQEVVIAEEDKQNPVFLSIKLKLADNAGNKNDEGITAAFISDLIKRQDEFECLPFYADVKNLLARNYDQLGHMYNRITKKFSSTQIGSLTDFYSETDNNGVISLYATARVPKREREICIRLAELFELGKLCVSFEVRYNPEYTIEKDGVLFIDANEENALTGIALVSMPACEDAVALDMVAEVADGSDAIVAESEEHVSERGETETMPKEQEMTAEVEVKVAEEETEKTETESVQEENPVAVAEGEGASESGEGASESGEGASESGEGASESGEGASESGSGAGGSGAGGSEGDDGDDEGDDAGADALTIDHEDEKKANAEAQDANAEVVDHSVETYEAVEKCPETGETMHVQVVTERLVETVDPETVIAEKDAKIAELEAKIAELEEIKVQYDQIIAEREAAALAEKQAKAKAFAEKQGLNVEDTAVAEAIEKLDYAKIAELSMAENQEQAVEPIRQTVTLASFVEMEVSDDKYGGLLSRKKN